VWGVETRGGHHDSNFVPLLTPPSFCSTPFVHVYGENWIEKLHAKNIVLEPPPQPSIPLSPPDAPPS
jgi:hypothetical protein